MSTISHLLPLTTVGMQSLRKSCSVYASLTCLKIFNSLQKPVNVHFNLEMSAKQELSNITNDRMKRENRCTRAYAPSGQRHRYR